MRGHFLTRLLTLFTLILLFQSAAASAASSTASETAVCGSTISETLTAARQSLARSDAGSDHVALGCLIEAVSELNNRLPAGQTNDHPPTKMLQAPVLDVPVQVHYR